MAQYTEVRHTHCSVLSVNAFLGRFVELLQTWQAFWTYFFFMSGCGFMLLIKWRAVRHKGDWISCLYCACTKYENLPWINQSDEKNGFLYHFIIYKYILWRKSWRLIYLQNYEDLFGLSVSISPFVCKRSKCWHVFPIFLMEDWRGWQEGIVWTENGQMVGGGDGE